MEFIILAVIVIIGLVLARIIGSIVYYGLAIALIIWAVGAFSGFN